LGRLSRSQFKNDFYQLANFYQAQINPLYCSAASGVMILNALNYGEISSQKAGEIAKHNSSEIIQFPLYTQRGFFNEETDKIKPRTLIEMREAKSSIFENNEWHETYDAGLSLSDFAKILITHNLKVEKTHMVRNDEKSIEKFRKIAKEILADSDHFILSNFNGKILEQKTNGHIAPLVAYDEISDSVLILDPALHKNQWFWTPLPKLVEAMNSKDEEVYRGYLIVGKK